MNWIYNAHTPLAIAFLAFAAILASLNWRRR